MKLLFWEGTLRAEFFFNKCHEAIHLGWHVCLSHMSTSSISSIIRPSVIITQCPDLPFFVCHTKRRVLTTCSENEKESGSQGERQEHKYQKKRSLFVAVFLRTVVTSYPSLSSSLYLYVTHIVARNIISCSKQEVKNNTSHRNLGSGEGCLTGMADYWCIFNKVKDLQWCMRLPFQSGRPCHLFGLANSRDVSNGEACRESTVNRWIMNRSETGLGRKQEKIFKLYSYIHISVDVRIQPGIVT